ncbi:hemolysin family protein [Treponema sp.]|uniref:hemolysin family protein n=1 Tax=Treponema sp. TaxID=166 RepID=UPI0025CC7418|nr:hemolysin family protein [Treponema sp.]MCR5218467.1 hemolysin family protein [Treponema sp.]
MVLILVAVFLIILSMIFSATESAFLAANKLRIRVLKNQKNKAAIRVWKLLNDKERLINTLLVANDIVNISLSSILAYISIQLFGNAGVGIATFAATILLLIFGEISPKTFATHHPEPIAFFFSGFVVFLEFLLYPFVIVFSAFSRFVLRVFKVQINHNKVSFTEEEIKTYIDVSGEHGVLERSEKNMMHKVFKFSDLEAKDIMIPRKEIKAVPLDESYKNLVELSERFRLSRFPVYKKDIDDIVGILYVKDLLFYKNRQEDFSIEKVMRPPLFILETKKMSSIQQMLTENHQGMAVVIDEYSGTNGVLTTEDIAREIFGPIADEYKPYAKRVDVVINNKKNTEVSGLSRILDINEQLNIKLYSENCETIGGYISEALGHIPEEGEGISRDNYRFTVKEMDDKRVSSVLIRCLGDDHE